MLRHTASIAAGCALVLALGACQSNDQRIGRTYTYPGGNPAAVYQYSTNPYAGGAAPPFWGGPDD